jgi:flagellar biosynthesis protein FlhF
MNVKTFQGGSIADALAKVKSELGSGAVILHTRSFKRGGIMGVGAKTVVEITAGVDVSVRKKAASGGRVAAAANRSRGNDEESGGGVAVAERGGMNPLKVVYAKNRLSGAETATRSGGAAGGGIGSGGGVNSETRQMAATLAREPAFEIRNEIASLRTMVESLLQRTAGNGGRRADLPAQLGLLYRQLIEQQVSDEIAMRVVDDVRAELGSEQLGNGVLVKERLMQKLEAMLPANLGGSVARPTVGAGCRSICLIGPTGVGKTTTIAKLAAAFKLRQRQKVGLITIDTYRIAAVDQLRTYANIIGVPLKVVLTPAELVAAMKEMADCDTILIDTAGRSPTDQLKLNELSGFIAAAKPTEVHLVLSSTTHQENMEAALEQFSKVRVDQIIFTKLDEAVSFGVLLNVARKASRALSYLTTGQDVPDNIEAGQPRRLARLILGEKV